MENPFKHIDERLKGKLKVALTYFITMFVCLILFGLAGVYIINNFIVKDNKTEEPKVIDNTPTAEMRNTLMFFQIDESNNLKNCLIVRNIPDQGKINIVPVTPYMISQVDDDSNKMPLEKIYEGGGISNAIKAVENSFKIKIDKYMTISNEAFDTMASYIGGVNYVITENMYYSDSKTGEEISFQKGNNVILNNQQMRLFINYPDFENGKGENLKVTADIMTRFLNGGFSQFKMLEDNLDNIFNVFFNESHTNITRNEYLHYKKTLIYLMNNYTNLVESMTPIGTWKGNTFEVNPAFTEELSDYFQLK